MCMCACMRACEHVCGFVYTNVKTGNDQCCPMSMHYEQKWIQHSYKPASIVIISRSLIVSSHINYIIHTIITTNLHDAGGLHFGELGPPNITHDGPPTMISISCIQQHLLCLIICSLESEKSFQKYHFQYNKKTQTSIHKHFPSSTGLRQNWLKLSSWFT